MLSLVDINSFTAFSRVCNQNNIPRDMEAEVIRYFIGLNKDKWYLIVFSMHGDDRDMNYWRIHNKSLYEKEDDFYLAVIKDIMNAVYEYNAAYNSEYKVKLFDDYLEAQTIKYYNHDLIKPLSISGILDDNDFPFSELTWYFKSVRLIRL